MMSNNDTICAPATSTGGALAIIRLSGPDAISIASRIIKATPPSPQEEMPEMVTMKPNTIHYAHIVAPSSGEEVDDVMVSVFRAPHSYTGEDSVEISCHGSRYIVQQVLDLLTAHGCRTANPGEFTQRAYLNGKMDLSQAEAVADLIASTNRATHQMAISQLRGHLSSELAQLRGELLRLTSLLELELDFSDHEDLEFADRNELQELARHTDTHIGQLARSFEAGQAIKQGIPVAIVGKTNVGKSTLLNRLLKEERAIVSPIHGTTRDTIEDTIDINGVTFRFIDTAGLRQTNDQIEQIGISRTYQAIGKARVVLWLIDRQPSEEEVADMTGRCKDRTLLIVRNKSDIACNPPIQLPNTQLITVSAKYGQGIDELQQAIYSATGLPELKETGIIVTNARHHEALLHARENLHRVITGLTSGISGDLIAEDLRLVLADLSEITGQGLITPQETLNNIFSHFCVGK